MLSRHSAAIALVAIALFAACDDDPTDPSGPEGTYIATQIRGVEGTTEIDLLALGTELEITLYRDRTTSGSLFVPEGDEDGSDFDVSLVGTWAQAGTSVTFDHAADTFLRDMTFTYDDGVLHAEEEFGDGNTLSVTLARD